MLDNSLLKIPHQQIIESSNANKFEQCLSSLLDNTLFEIVRLHSLVYFIEKIDEIIHAELRSRRRLQQFIQKSVAIIRDKTWKGLRFNDGRDNHLVQASFELLHPGVINVELETFKVVLDDRNQSVVFLPFKIIHFRSSDRCQQLALSNADERQHFLDIG